MPKNIFLNKKKSWNFDFVKKKNWQKKLDFQILRLKIKKNKVETRFWKKKSWKKSWIFRFWDLKKKSDFQIFRFSDFKKKIFIEFQILRQKNKILIFSKYSNIFRIFKIFWDFSHYLIIHNFKICTTNKLKNIGSM